MTVSLDQLARYSLTDRRLRNPVAIAPGSVFVDPRERASRTRPGRYRSRPYFVDLQGDC
jgi:hypothetical protein